MHQHAQAAAFREVTVEYLHHLYDIIEVQKIEIAALKAALAFQTVTDLLPLGG